MPIGLILSLIWKLPSLLRTGMAILKLLSNMKGKSLPEIVAAVQDIIKLILEIAPQDKAQAKAITKELHETLKTETASGMQAGPDTLTKLNDLKRRCSGMGCAPDLK
jgi:hypothetical protein